MKIKLIINGEDHRLRMTPETDVDKKLLEFVAENQTTNIVVKREDSYGYAHNKAIEAIDFEMENRPTLKED